MVANEREIFYPLTAIQKDIWIDQMTFPEVPFYNIGGYLRIDGRVEPEIFQRALCKILRENDAFRIVLQKNNLPPAQRFSEEDNFEIPFIDFSHEERPMEKAEEWLQEQFVKPFDLHAGLLFRYALVKVSEVCYCYLNVQHHMILDGISIAFIGERLAEAYNALLAGDESPADFPSYRDAIEEDREFQTSKRFQQGKEFWKEVYKTLPEPLIPRRKKSVSPTEWLKGGFSIFWIERERFDRLEEFSRQHSATPFHLLLAALYIYFLKITGNREFVFGAPVLNRSSAAAKKTIGLFTSVAPIRLEFGLKLNGKELLEEITKELKRCYRYQRYPLGEINRDCGILKEDRQLFDLSVSYESFDYKTRFNGAGVEAVTLHNGYERNSLAIALKEYHPGEDIRIDFSYNRGAFEEGEIALLNDRLLHLMEEIMEQPEVPLDQLEIMTEQERNRLLFAWNDTERPFPDDRCAHDLFSEQARKTPEEPALLFENERMTYRELEEASNKMSHYLRSRGVGKGSLVGVCSKPSREMVVTILAVMKAGGAYLPLDPDCPQERLLFMLEDSGAEVVVMQETFSPLFTEWKGRKLLLDENNFSAFSLLMGEDKGGGDQFNYHPPLAPPIEGGELNQEGEGEDDYPCKNEPEANAYVIYTSGSTGRPKGVTLRHRGLCNLIQAQIRLFDIQAKDRVLQFASFGFDASVSEIFTALCSGATLVLALREKMLPGQSLIDTVNRYGVTHITLPPSSLSVLPEVELSSLKTLVVAGEACPASLLEKWGEQCRVLNAYGPTETTVCASIGEYEKGSDRVSIGKPIDNTRLYILDKAMKPVPIGVPGELYIAGVGVAQGYLNRPELTQERFLPDPFGKGAISLMNEMLTNHKPELCQVPSPLMGEDKGGGGQINYHPPLTPPIKGGEILKEDDTSSNREGEGLYKTGDSARWLPEGNIEFLGRLDQQVKIRGYRIELEEIEAVLREHPSIENAVVVLRGDDLVGKQLVAWVIEKRGIILDKVDLKAYLRKKLPDYMVPSLIETIDEFPLTPSGKIDRKAFPEPFSTSKPAEDEVEGVNETEEKLRNIFVEMTGIRTIARDENVFDAGLDSLLAIQFLKRIEEKFSITMQPAELFQKNTIQKLAHHVERNISTSGDVCVAIKPDGSKPPFFCVTAGFGDLLAFQSLGRHWDAERPFYVLQPPSMQDPSQKIDLQSLTGMYLKHIREVQPEGPYHLGGYSAGGLIAFEMAQKLIAQGEEVDSFVLLGLPFTLGAVGYRFQRLMTKLAGTFLPEVPSSSPGIVRILQSLFRDAGLQTHLEVLVGYSPKPYPGRITLLEGRWASSRFFFVEKQWHTIAEQGLEIRLLPGNHDSFLRPPYQEELVETLETCLNNGK